MSRVAETPHCVKNIAAPTPKRLLILDLLRRGNSDHWIASTLGVHQAYVRSVRSRYIYARDDATRRRRSNGHKDPNAPPKARPRLDLSHLKRASGQPREELHELAQTLYRWRQEGRYAQ